MIPLAEACVLHHAPFADLSAALLTHIETEKDYKKREDPEWFIF